MTLQQLIYEVKKGGKAAEEALFSRLSPYCFAVCVRYVKNEADAEEMMQDGLYKFFRLLPQFKYESDPSLYTWLSGIMVHECIMHLRKKKLFNIIAEPSETDAIYEEDMLGKLSAAEIYGMISRLPSGARTIFNLFEVEGYRHDEIARFLGITIGTSKSQLARAKALLQQSITNLTKDHEKQS